jgi:uncharacterized membrane protein YedE/YeeE
MTIDWAHFTPISALAGGLMIGVAAALLILGAGRILGASSIVGGALELHDGEAPWRRSLIVGLLATPLIAHTLWGLGAPAFSTNGLTLAIAGVLVGFGTRLGSGCTSGHGVCGLARLSPRSFAATLIFMATGFATVFVVRHVIG